MNIDSLQRKIIEDRKLIFDEPYYKRDFTLTLLPGHVSILLGSRRIGKTSYLRGYAHSLIKEGVDEKKICYLNFFGLNEEFSPFLIEDAFYSLYPELENAKDVWFFFDEIYVLPNWGNFVTSLLDKRKCHVIVTGSSAKSLATDLATELRGRHITSYFYPLSFKEFLTFDGFDLSSKEKELSISKTTFYSEFTKYMDHGSYPVLANIESEDVRRTLLFEYIALVFSEDIVERYKYEITKSGMLKDLLDRVIKNSGSPTSINKLLGYVKSIGYKSNAIVIDSYIQMIESTLFINEVPIFGTDKQQRVNPIKYYTIDHQMAVLFRDYSTGRGIILEHIVHLALRRLTNYIYYYRSSNDYEVDFVVTDTSHTPLLAIQVSDTQEALREREERGLIAALNDLKLKKGLIITDNLEEEKQIEDKIIEYIPCWKFTLHAEAILLASGYKASDKNALRKL